MTVKTLLIGACLTVACSGVVTAEEINPVLGKVNDFVLREADLERIIANQPPAVQKRFQEDPQQLTALTREILIKKAIVAKARKDRFDRKPEIKEQLGYVFDDFIAQEYLAKVVTAGISVPEEELKKFYRNNEKDFQLPAQVKVRHILISATKDAKPEEKEKSRTKAEDILQRLKKGEDFTKLAGEFSEDQLSASSGGELAPITPGKTNSEEFEKAAFALKNGEISTVVATTYGFHIIKMIDHQEQRTAPFSEAREFILNKLKTELEQKKALEFIELAVKEAGMEIYGDRKTAGQEGGDAAPKTPVQLNTGK